MICAIAPKSLIGYGTWLLWCYMPERQSSQGLRFATGSSLRPCGDGGLSYLQSMASSRRCRINYRKTYD